MNLSPMHLDEGQQPVKALRERRTGEAVFELCEGCWAPVLAGKLEDHRRTIPHRQPPMGADSPEG